MRRAFGWCTARLHAPSRLPFILFGSSIHNSFPIFRQKQKNEEHLFWSSAKKSEFIQGELEENLRSEKDDATSSWMAFQQVVQQLGSPQQANASSSSSSSFDARSTQKSGGSAAKTKKTEGFQAILLWCAFYQVKPPRILFSSASSGSEDLLYSSPLSQEDNRKHADTPTDTTTTAEPSMRDFVKGVSTPSERIHEKPKGREWEEQKEAARRGPSAASVPHHALSSFLASCRDVNDAALGWIHQHLEAFTCGQSLVLLSLVCDILYQGLCYLPLFDPSSSGSPSENIEKNNAGVRDSCPPQAHTKTLHSKDHPHGSTTSARVEEPLSASSSLFSVMEAEYLRDFIGDLQDTAIDLLRHIELQPAAKLEAQGLPLLASGLYAVFRVQEKLKQRQCKREARPSYSSLTPEASSREYPSPPPPHITYGERALPCFATPLREEDMAHALHAPLSLLRRAFAQQLRPPSSHGFSSSASPLSSLIVSNPSLGIKIMLVFFLCIPPDVRKTIFQQREPAVVRSLSVLLTRTLQPFLSLREKKWNGTEGKDTKSVETALHPVTATDLSSSSSVHSTAVPAESETITTSSLPPHDHRIEEESEDGPAFPSTASKRTTEEMVTPEGGSASCGTSPPLSMGNSEGERTEEVKQEEEEERLHTMDYLEECMKIFYHMKDHPEIRSLLKLCLLEYFLVRIRSPASYSAEELALFPLLLRPLRDIPSQYRHNIVKALIVSSRLLQEVQTTVENDSTCPRSLPKISPSGSSQFFSTLARLLPFLYFPKDLVQRSGVHHWPPLVQAKAVMGISAVESAEILRHTASYLPPVVGAQLQLNVAQTYLAKRDRSIGKEPIPLTHQKMAPEDAISPTTAEDTDLGSGGEGEPHPALRHGIPLTPSLVYALHHFFFSEGTSSSSTSCAFHLVESVRTQLLHPFSSFFMKRNARKGESLEVEEDSEKERIEEVEVMQQLQRALRLAYTTLLSCIDWEGGVQETCTGFPSSSAWSFSPSPTSSSVFLVPPLRKVQTTSVTHDVTTPLEKTEVSTRKGSTGMMTQQVSVSNPVPPSLLYEDSFYAYYCSPFLSSSEERAHVLRTALEVYFYLRETPLYSSTPLTEETPARHLPLSIPALSDKTLLQHYLYPLFVPSPTSSTATASSTPYVTHNRIMSILPLVSRAVPHLATFSHRAQLIERAIRFNASSTVSHSSSKGMKKNSCRQEVLRFLQYFAPLATSHSVVSTVALESLLDPSLTSLNPLRAFNRHHWGTGETGIRGLAKYYTSVVLAACEYCFMVVCHGEPHLAAPSSSSTPTLHANNSSNGNSGSSPLKSSSSTVASLLAGHCFTEGGKDNLITPLVQSWLDDYFKHLFHLEFQLSELLKPPPASPSFSEDATGEVSEAEEEQAVEEEEDEDEESCIDPAWKPPSASSAVEYDASTTPSSVIEEAAEDSAEGTPSRDRIGEGENELLSEEELHRLLTAAIRLGVQLPSSVFYRLIQQPMERLPVLPTTTTQTTVRTGGSLSGTIRKGINGKQQTEEKEEYTVAGMKEECEAKLGEEQEDTAMVARTTPSTWLVGSPKVLLDAATFIYYIRSGRALPFPLTIPFLRALLESCDVRIFHLSLSAFLVGFNAQCSVEHSSSLSSSSSVTGQSGRRRGGGGSTLHTHDTTGMLASGFSGGKLSRGTNPRRGRDPNGSGTVEEWREKCRAAWETLPCVATLLVQRLMSPAPPSPSEAPELLHPTAKSGLVAHVWRVLLHQMDRVAAFVSSSVEVEGEREMPCETSVMLLRKGEEQEEDTVLVPTLPHGQQGIVPFSLPRHEVELVERVLSRCVTELVDPSHLKKVCLTFLHKMYLWFPAVAALLFQQFVQKENETLTLKELFSLSIAYPPAHRFVDSSLKKMDLKKGMEFSDFLPQLKQLPMGVIETVLTAHVPTLSFAWCSRLLSSLSSRQGELPFSLLDAILTRLESHVPASSDSDRHLVLMVLQGYLLHHTPPPVHTVSSSLTMGGDATEKVEEKEVHASKGKEKEEKKKNREGEEMVAKKEALEEVEPRSIAPMHHTAKYQRLFHCYTIMTKVNSVVDLSTLKEFLRLTPSSLHSHILPALIARVEYDVLPPLLVFSLSSAALPVEQASPVETAESAASVEEGMTSSSPSLPTPAASFASLRTSSGSSFLFPLRDYLQRILHVTQLLHQEKILHASLRLMILQVLFPLDDIFRQALHMTAAPSLTDPSSSSSANRIAIPSIQVACSSPSEISDTETKENTLLSNDRAPAFSSVTSSSTTSSPASSCCLSGYASYSTCSSPVVDEIVSMLAELVLLLGEKYVSNPSSVGCRTAFVTTTGRGQGSHHRLSPPTASSSVLPLSGNGISTTYSISSLVMQIATFFSSAAHRLLLLSTLVELNSSTFGIAGGSGSTSAPTLMVGYSRNGASHGANRMHAASRAATTSSSGGGPARLLVSSGNRKTNTTEGSSMSTSVSGSLIHTSVGGNGGIHEAIDLLMQLLLSEQCGEFSSARFVKLILLVSKTKRWHLLPPGEEATAPASTPYSSAASSFHQVFRRIFFEADAHTRCVLMRALSTDATLLHRYEHFMVQPMLDSINVLGYEDLELLLTTMIPMQSMALVEALLDAVGTRLFALLPTQCRASTLVRLLQCHATFQIEDDHLLTRVLSALEQQVSSSAFGMIESHTSHSGRGAAGGISGGGAVHSSSELRLSTTQIIYLLQSIVKLDLRAPERLLLACFARVEKVVETLPHHQVLQLTRLAVEVEMEYSPAIHALVTAFLDHNHRASDYRTSAEEKETVELLCDVYDVELPFHWRRVKLRDRRRKNRQMEAKFFLEQKRRAEMIVK